MMDPPPTPTPMPVTPARRKDRSDVVAAFERFWLDFFPRYGLAWPLPAKDSSPSKPKGETGDVVAIYYNLRFICLQDNKTKNDEDKTTTSLDAIRFRFHEGARQLCKKWVTKPGDRDVTPPLRGQPRATNPAEQRSLRDLLKEIVADYLPEGGAAGVESDHLFSPPKLPTPTSQNVSPRSKRLSGDVQESPSQKRAKSMASSSSSLGNHGRPATPVHRRDSDVFSSKKLSSALETPPGFFAAPSLGRERTYASSSANTSHLTLLSKVFDDDDEQAPPASQDTQITTDTTKERTSPSSQDSYPVSSADIRAFYESLGQQESEAALPNHRIVPVESGSPVSSDDASLLAEQLAAEQLAADLERQAADRDVPAIEKRLRITWRESWLPILPAMAECGLLLIECSPPALHTGSCSLSDSVGNLTRRLALRHRGRRSCTTIRRRLDKLRQVVENAPTSPDASRQNLPRRVQYESMERKPRQLRRHRSCADVVGKTGVESQNPGQLIPPQTPPV